MRVLVLNGPNLSRLGTREPDVYGSATYAELAARCHEVADSLDLDIEVRQTNAEHELIGWLHEAADSGAAVVLNPAAFTHYSYALRERFARDDVWVLVADDDGAVVGVAQGAPARQDGGAGPVVPGRCHLSMVFVRPDRWGEGIGSRLVDSAVAVAAGLGYDTVQLYTHEDNHRAQRLYVNRGFERDGDVRDDAWGEPVGRWARRLGGSPS